MLNDPPPRRNWHLTRWFLVLIVATLSWSGWRAYTFRDALAQANALGWHVFYTDPIEEIRKDWKAAFKKETWLEGVTSIGIPTSDAFEQNLAIVYRLNPLKLQLRNAATLRDLSALKPLTRLQDIRLFTCTGLTNVDALQNLSALRKVRLIGCPQLTNVDALKNLSALRLVQLTGCTGLTNVDALKNLPALEDVYLHGCTGLTNVDGLKNLSALQEVELTGCPGLTPESVAALRAALPNARISGR